MGVWVLGVAGAVLAARDLPATAHLATSLQKMKALGVASTEYAADHDGLLPLEDALGKDDWTAAARAGSEEVWYNALLKQMNQRTVGQLADTPEEFYADAYPLYLPGAVYPAGEKRLARPYFAFGMNSLLQQKNEEGEVQRVRLGSIIAPAKTVLFLERGLPGEKKVSPRQSRFDGSPKARHTSFVCRHKEGTVGLLLYADGHVSGHEFSELDDERGRVVDGIIWTKDPKEEQD